MSNKVHMVDLPAKQIPTIKYHLAKEAGIKKIMMTTSGGLGDQVVAEPTLRYAFKLFPDYEISLLTSFPELFTHLPFCAIYDVRSPEARVLNENEWLTIHTNPKENELSRDFLLHHFTQVVDFCSLNAFQRQLPISERVVHLPSSDFWLSCRSTKIIVHPGRHWPSKTFPKSWWDEVIAKLGELYPHQVAIIGKDVNSKTGTVEVEVPETVIDLRNKLTLNDSIGLLQRAEVVLTNDSSPLHIAASGRAFIVFIASCKEADHLYHWRYTQWEGGPVAWAYRMVNLGNDGLWNHLSSCPVRDEPLMIDDISPDLMKAILPAPQKVINRIRMII